MESSPFRERRFPPSEVRRILRRAADLAEHDAGTRAAERPLTQEEIERLGGELGLPATAIREALRDDAEPERAEEGAAYGPRRIVFEDQIEGELPASRQEDVIDAITTIMGDAGRAQIVGRTLTWTPTPIANNQQRALTITVRARDGRTRVRVDENLEQIYLGLTFGIGFGLGLGGGAGVGVPLALALHSWMVGLAVGLVFVAMAVLLPVVIYRALHERRTRELAKLRARIGGAVREGISASAGRTSARKRIATAEDDGAADVEAESEAEAAEEGERARR